MLIARARPLNVGRNEVTSMEAMDDSTEEGGRRYLDVRG
jgi:hypothetical protein